MIVVDANVLIYAYNSRAPQHGAARRWVEDAFTGAEVVALPWAVVHAFLRLVTSHRVVPQPMTMHDRDTRSRETGGLFRAKWHLDVHPNKKPARRFARALTE